MKKRYIFMIASIIFIIAYIDLIDSFKQIDKALSEFTGIKTVTVRGR